MTTYNIQVYTVLLLLILIKKHLYHPNISFYFLYNCSEGKQTVKLSEESKVCIGLFNKKYFLFLYILDSKNMALRY